MFRPRTAPLVFFSSSTDKLALMKKFLILIVLFALHQELLAQLSPGSFVATGSFGYSISNKKGADNSFKGSRSSYTLSPQVGYLVSNNLEAGIIATLYKDVLHEKYTGAPESYQHTDFKTTQKAIGVYLKKYILITDKLAFLGSGEIAFRAIEHKYNSSSHYSFDHVSFKHSDAKNKSVIAAIRPRLSYFFSEKISLNANYGVIRYQMYTTLEEVKEQDYAGETLFRNTKELTRNLNFDLSSSSFTLALSYFF